jgi:hypothetical protein
MLRKIDWDGIWQFYDKMYYTPLFLLAAAIIALALELKVKKRINFQNIVLRIYIIVFIFVWIITELSPGLINSENRKLFLVDTNVAFALFELFCFFAYFNFQYPSRTFKWLCYSFILLFQVILLQYLLHRSQIDKLERYADTLISFELFAITICCFRHFYLLLVRSQNKALVTIPSFWVTTGLFFYALVSVPFFLISTYVSEINMHVYRILFSLHYFLMTIFFIGIAKAALCRPKQIN